MFILRSKAPAAESSFVCWVCNKRNAVGGYTHCGPCGQTIADMAHRQAISSLGWLGGRHVS